jgi:MFS family permease
VVRSHPHAPARATGITQIGTYIGGMVGPLSFGLVADHAGYDTAWLVSAGLAAIGAVGFGAGRTLLARAIQPAPDATSDPRCRDRRPMPRTTPGARPGTAAGPVDDGGPHP